MIRLLYLPKYKKTLLTKAREKSKISTPQLKGDICVNIWIFISKEAGFVISAIGVVLTALALIQANSQKEKGKNPMFFHVVAAISIILVLIFAVSYFFVQSSHLETNSPVGVENDFSDDLGDGTKRIVLTSCDISNGKIRGSYTFENYDGKILLQQGDLFSIENESNWKNISNKLSFSHNEADQEFSFLIVEALPNGNYACELRCLAENETFIIEIHFDVENGNFFGESCNEIYSNGTSSKFTDTKDLRDSGL